MKINVHKALSHLRYGADTAKCGKTLIYHTYTYINIYIYMSISSFTSVCIGKADC